MRGALLENDWEKVAASMRKAHPNRKKLAPNITTPQMDVLIEKALNNGAEAAKVCGAGGGGCIAFLQRRKRPQVEKALAEMPGVEVLNWKISHEGLTIREE